MANGGRWAGSFAQHACMSATKCGGHSWPWSSVTVAAASSRSLPGCCPATSAAAARRDCGGTRGRRCCTATRMAMCARPCSSNGVCKLHTSHTTMPNEYLARTDRGSRTEAHTTTQVATTGGADVHVCGGRVCLALEHFWRCPVCCADDSSRPGDTPTANPSGVCVC